jgi:hypothetical protein
MSVLTSLVMPIKVLVALPAYGRQVDVSHVPMWIRIGIAFEQRVTDFSFLGAAVMDECNLARVRNALMIHALDQKADWLLTVDADTHVRNAEALLDMIMEGHNQDAAVIAAPVRHRAVASWNVQGPIEFFLDCLTPVDSIGAAVMAINVNWLRKNWPSVNPEPWFQFLHMKDNLWMGEDLAFCAGVRRRGGVVLCDGRVHTAHRTHGEYLE